MKKIFSLFAVLLFAVSAMAIDWSSIDWVQASNNKFKVGAEDEANLPSVINVQQPGFATEPGIYMTFPAADITCSHNCAVQGAGIVLYTSQFTMMETEVTVNYAGGSKTFVVYFADGVDAKFVKDYNYAKDGTATASSGTAGAAIDNNMGTRWESAAADPQWWQLDLGQKCVFNTIQIEWEGAYAKTFTISVSDDATNWTVVKTVTDVTLGAPWPNQQNYELDADVTARYVRFDGTVRGTGYGYSFWEFRVLYPNVSVLSSLSLSAAATMAKVGAPVNLTVGAKDQNNVAMEPGEVEWVITPAAAGHVTDGKYIADQAGTATIKAKVGTVMSPEVSVLSYAGDNLSLSTNIGTDNKVIAQSAFSPKGTDAFYAVDANEGSVYQGSATDGTAGDEASRTFDSWFVLDLGAYYTIELITVKFEGACSQEYHIDFAEAYDGESTVWTTAYNYVGNSGVNAHTDVWNDNVIASQKVRFVRFFSTKAATQWGMKIFDMKVIGVAWVPSSDTEAPVMGTATVASVDWNKVVLNVAATDNTEVAVYHIVDATNGIDLNIPAATQISINGLTAATTYNFTVTAKDLVGNESANSVDVEATTLAHYTAPQTAAPVPTVRAAWVAGVFSDAYTCVNTGAHEGWGDATVYEAIDVDGDNIRLYHNLNWLGWGISTPLNVTNMEKLHIDIWAENDGQLGIVPIFGGDGLTTDDTRRKIVTLVGQQWNSFDFDLAVDYAGLDLSSIFQFKFDNAVGGYFGIDNVYFYQEGFVRTVTTGDYGTICLAKAATLEGATAFEVVGKTETAIVLNEVAALAAGVPYIFQATADELVATLSGDAVAEAGSANGLVGTFAAIVGVEGAENVLTNNYILSNNTVKLCGTGCSIGANRAYINLANVPAATPAPEHRVIAIADVATALENANAENVVKMMENGQLIIIKNGVRYNALGQVVK